MRSSFATPCAREILVSQIIEQPSAVLCGYEALDTQFCSYRLVTLLTVCQKFEVIDGSRIAQHPSISSVRRKVGL